MYIELHRNDIKKIVAGEGQNTPMEIALAKKCMDLYDKLGKQNDENSSFFHAIYSAYRTFEKAAGERLKDKHRKDLEGTNKALLEQAATIDEELMRMG